MPASLAMTGLGLAMKQYHQAADYLRQEGLQTSNDAYGGSRSFVYYDMLGKAATVREMVSTHRQYTACHQTETSNHDIRGALLRVAAYRLRKVPFVHERLNRLVVQDDALMAGANFSYPDDVVRHIRPIGSSIDELR
jgi:hypothetical protein